MFVMYVRKIKELSTQGHTHASPAKVRVTSEGHSGYRGGNRDLCHTKASRKTGRFRGLVNTPRTHSSWTVVGFEVEVVEVF